MKVGHAYERRLVVHARPACLYTYRTRLRIYARLTVHGMADAIDILSATPAYEQLAAILRARIKSGKLAPDRPLPSEKQLTDEFGIARGTVRKAIDVLRNEGLIVTVHGRGSYVRPVK